MKHKIILSAFLFVAALAFAASPTNQPFGEWRRLSGTPILSPRGTTWESAGTFNPAVIFVPSTNPKDSASGTFVMLYRALFASGTSRLGYA